jgi:hypothetical protein
MIEIDLYNQLLQIDENIKESNPLRNEFILGIQISNFD